MSVRSIRGRVAARTLFGLSAVLMRLPEAPLRRIAWASGGALYRAQPERRRLVRANLGRVCTYLVAQGLATPRTAAAARDAHQLDRLTRAAFGHYMLSYLEGATVHRYATAAELTRVVPDDDAITARAFPTGRRGPTIVIGLHFGAVEIPALWATARGVPMTAPMETVSDPSLQVYFEHSRSSTGLRIIPLDGAASRVRRALKDGETVALVADRPIGGRGVRVELFGAPARLTAGPAVLAVASRAPTWVVAARRVGRDYRTRIEQLEVPTTGTPRERIEAVLNAQARAFERIIADAPEQWWTMFFPIWDDIGKDDA